MFEPPVDFGVGTASGTDANAASARAPIGAGRTVTVVDLSSEDAYFSDKATIVGKSCTTQEETSYKEVGWHGGSVSCGVDSYYFYKAGLSDQGPGSGGSGQAVPKGVAMSAVPAGIRVKLLDLSPDDAYYSDKAAIVGQHCVTKDATTDNGGGWHGGAIVCGTNDYYFYKVKLEVE